MTQKFPVSHGENAEGFCVSKSYKDAIMSNRLKSNVKSYISEV